MRQIRLNYSLTQLEYVLAVYKYGHFAKAAAACHVTQPTLSMQVHKLEEDLGIVIFDRAKKPILLTDAGQRVIEQIQAVLDEAKKIEQLVESAKSTETHGQLVLGVIPTIAPYLLPRLLGALDQDYPKIEVDILELQTEKIIEALNNDEIDVGLLATPLKIAKIFEKPLFYEPFSVLCRKGHELTKNKKVHYDRLRGDDVWLLQEGHCLRNQVVDVCSIRKSETRRRKFKFESGSLETLKNLVEMYGGYTLLPQLAASSIGEHSQLVPFERPIPAREVGLVYRREHYKGDLIEALGHSILKSIPESLRGLRPKDLAVLPVD